jgi:hypothetical protein
MPRQVPEQHLPTEGFADVLDLDHGKRTDLGPHPI